MKRRLATISLLVNDYDEAIDFYLNKLGFILVEDSPITPLKRWVLIRPSQDVGCNILLAKAKNEDEKAAIGNQSGSRVFLFMECDDLATEHQNLINNKVTIIQAPRNQPYGKVLVFQDLYGNKWDMIEPTKSESN